MYIDNKGKWHELTEEMLSLIGEGRKEIILDNGQGWLHLVGADETGAYNEEDNDKLAYEVYGQDIESIPNKDNIQVFKVVGNDVIMKCGHVADWIGFNKVCCSICGWNENGQNSGNKAAFDIDHDKTKHSEVA